YITLHPGNRSDFLVQAPKKGKYLVYSDEVSRSTPDDAPTRSFLARIEVDGEVTTPMALPTDAEVERFRRPDLDLDPKKAKVRRLLEFQSSETKGHKLKVTSDGVKDEAAAEFKAFTENPKKHTDIRC